MLQTRISSRTAFSGSTKVASTRPVCRAPVSSSSRASQRVITCAAALFKGDLLNKSYYPTSADAANVSKQWYIIDAEGKTLGRLACLAATYIRGKHLNTYSPSMDMGAYVVVINAEKVTLTGNKMLQKTYFTHGNGRPGSGRVETFVQLQARLPERIVERAVKGMLPKGRLGKDIRLHLKVFKGSKHEHEAQTPVDITSHISLKPKNGPGVALLTAEKASAQ
ncbi:MAG: hypothetical protein WDW38_005966 [Sanguina aurantia]